MREKARVDPPCMQKGASVDCASSGAPSTRVAIQDLRHDHLLCSGSDSSELQPSGVSRLDQGLYQYGINLPTHEALEMTQLDGSVAGAVLIGGRSRRMGVPKALLRVPDNGPTMAERTVNTVRACADHVFLVGINESVVPERLADVRIVMDSGEGPVDGLIAALRATDRARVLVTGCDMPFLSPELLRLVIARSIRTRRGVYPVVTHGDGSESAQPLTAVYQRDQLEEVVRLFEAGVRSLTGIVTSLNMLRMESDQFRRLDPGLWSFFNVNTPRDLQIARRHAKEIEIAAGGILESDSPGDRK